MIWRRPGRKSEEGTFEIDQAELKRILKYDPETGLWTRLISAGGQKAGSTTLGWLCENGHFYIRAFRKLYQSSRLAWFYTYGEWPSCEVDHIDLDTGNNRLNNLRVATRSQNGANRRAQRNNTSGLKGVWRHKQMHKWCAEVGHKKLGLYDCPAAAHLAYVVEHDKVYGEFSRTR